MATFILSLRDFYRHGVNPDWEKEIFEYWGGHNNELKSHFGDFATFLSQVDGNHEWKFFGKASLAYNRFQSKKRKNLNEMDEFSLSPPASPQLIPKKTYVLSDYESDSDGSRTPSPQTKCVLPKKKTYLEALMGL